MLMDKHIRNICCDVRGAVAGDRNGCAFLYTEEVIVLADSSNDLQQMSVMSCVAGRNIDLNINIVKMKVAVFEGRMQTNPSYT